MCSQKFDMHIWFVTLSNAFASVDTCICDSMPLLKGPVRNNYALFGRKKCKNFFSFAKC